MKKPFIVEGEIDISPLLEAFKQFHEALPVAKSDLEKAGAVQYFEFTYELAWKMLKRILKNRGKELNSPKMVFREAASEGLIDNPEAWFEFIDARNQTVHTYDKKIANEIWSDLPKFDTAVRILIDRLQNLK